MLNPLGWDEGHQMFVSEKRNADQHEDYMMCLAMALVNNPFSRDARSQFDTASLS